MQKIVTLSSALMLSVSSIIACTDDECGLGTDEVEEQVIKLPLSRYVDEVETSTRLQHMKELEDIYKKNSESFLEKLSELQQYLTQAEEGHSSLENTASQVQEVNTQVNERLQSLNTLIEALKLSTDNQASSKLQTSLEERIEELKKSLETEQGNKEDLLSDLSAANEQLALLKGEHELLNGLYSALEAEITKLRETELQAKEDAAESKSKLQAIESLEAVKLSLDSALKDGLSLQQTSIDTALETAKENLDTLISFTSEKTSQHQALTSETLQNILSKIQESSDASKQMADIAQTQQQTLEKVREETLEEKKQLEDRYHGLENEMTTLRESEAQSREIATQSKAKFEALEGFAIKLSLELEERDKNSSSAQVASAEAVTRISEKVEEYSQRIQEYLDISKEIAQNSTVEHQTLSEANEKLLQEKESLSNALLEAQSKLGISNTELESINNLYKELEDRLAKALESETQLKEEAAQSKLKIETLGTLESLHMDLEAKVQEQLQVHQAANLESLEDISEQLKAYSDLSAQVAEIAKKQHETLSETHSQALAEKTVLEAKYQELELEIDGIRGSEVALKEKVAQTTEKLNAFQSLDEMKTFVESLLKTELSQHQDSSSKALENISEQVQSYSSISKQTAELAQQQHEALITAYTKDKEDILEKARLSKEESEKNAQLLKEMENKNTQLQIDLASLSGQAEEMKKSLSTYEFDHSAMKENEKKLIEQLNKLTAQIAEKDTQVSMLKEEIAKNAETPKVTEEVVGLRETKNVLETQLTEKTTQLNETMEKVGELKTDLAQQKSLYEQAKEDCESHEQQSQLYSTLYRNAQIAINSLNAQLAAKAGEIDILNSTIQEIRKNITGE